MSRLERAIERVNNEKTLNEGNPLRTMHHLMMRRYGWVPLEQFLDLPLPTLYGLWYELLRELEMEAEAYDTNNSSKQSGMTKGIPSRIRY